MFAARSTRIHERRDRSTRRGGRAAALHALDGSGRSDGCAPARSRVFRTAGGGTSTSHSTSTSAGDSTTVGGGTTTTGACTTSAADRATEAEVS